MQKLNWRYIDGIQDYESNKTILYGAKLIKELREKLVYYESMTSRNKAKSDIFKHKPKPSSKQNSVKVQNKKCYNCGDKRHLAKDCPSKSMGTKF